MSELIPKGYIKDESTGYLTHQVAAGGQAFGVEGKKRFLQVMEDSGNLTETCRLLGISATTLYHHLEVDEAFNRDYGLMVRGMAHKLESVMYKNGQRPQGYMDRITWLRRWFPKDWTPKTSISVSQSDDNTLNDLFSDIDTSKIIDATLIQDNPETNQK